MLVLTFVAWAEAAHLGTLARMNTLHADRVLGELIRHPNMTPTDETALISELAAQPLAATEAVARVLREGWQSEAHPEDVLEAIARALIGIYDAHPQAVVRLLSDESLVENHELVRWAINRGGDAR